MSVGACEAPGHQHVPFSFSFSKGISWHELYGYSLKCVVHFIYHMYNVVPYDLNKKQMKDKTLLMESKLVKLLSL